MNSYEQKIYLTKKEAMLRKEHQKYEKSIVDRLYTFNKTLYKSNQKTNIRG